MQMHVPLDASVLWAGAQALAAAPLWAPAVPQLRCTPGQQRVRLLGPSCAALQGGSEANRASPPHPYGRGREGAAKGLGDVKAGSYTLDRFCMEPTSIKVGFLCGLCCGHWQGVGMLRAC